MLVPTNINGIVKLLRILDPKAVRYSYGKLNIVPRGFARRLSKMRGFSNSGIFSADVHAARFRPHFFLFSGVLAHFGCFMLLSLLDRCRVTGEMEKLASVGILLRK